jgi:hypothetical protein
VTSGGWILIGAFVIFAVLAAWLPMFLRRKLMFGPAFKGAPVPGTAQVVSVQETDVGFGPVDGPTDELRCKIALRVQLPGRAPYDTTILQLVDLVDHRPNLQPGATVVVTADSADPQNVRIDFTQPIRPGSEVRQARGAPPGSASELVASGQLGGAYTYKSSSGTEATWTITPSGPGSVNVASAGGRKAPFYGTAQLNGQTWTMVVHRPDVVKHRRSGDTGCGTTTFTWDAITLKGKVAARSDEGVLGRPARQLNTNKFTLTKNI